MIHETAQHLIAFTDNVQFERLVLEVLSYHEYPGIDPQSPGLGDGRKDALFYYDDGRMVNLFSRTFQSMKQGF